jgi:hypothetical protein
MNPKPSLLGSAARSAVLAMLACGAVALGWISLQRNVDRACLLDEWPNFSSCPAPETDVTVQLRDLRQRAAQNPGDASNYLALATLVNQEDAAALMDQANVLRAASLVAPNNPDLLRAQVIRQLAREDYEAAVPPLIRLAQEHRDGQAVRTLAGLLELPPARDRMLSLLEPGSRWLVPVLRSVPPAKVELALPLLAPALEKNLLSTEASLDFVRQLRHRGLWLEAQGLWLRVLGQSSPMLFNGGFEQGFLNDTFDWDVPNAPPARTGVQMAQPVVPGAQNRALELSFNGRPLALPVISQYLVLPPGRYVFNARYMTRNLQAGDGLMWAWRCVSTGDELARTEPLLDTRNLWQPFTKTLDVPPACVAVLMYLGTQRRSDGLSGVRGQAYFDDLRLSPG